jgi:signal transduction histidine kinase
MTKKRPARRQPSPPKADSALELAKLAAMKELAYGASHEINNPLANISTRAQTLLRMENDPEKRRMLASIHTQAMRAHEMIADLMLFARPPLLRCEEVDLVALVEQVIGEFRASATEQRTDLTLDVSPLHRRGGKGSGSRTRCGEVRGSVSLKADPTQLAVAIRALIQNSLEAIGSDGQIKVAVSADSEQVTITIADNGPGIPAEIRPHIFEPFYSGREAGRGLGFGLSKCWRIVTDHGGQIDCIPNRPRGATFRIRLGRTAQ